MKRLGMTVLAVAVLAMAIAACGSSSKKTTTTTSSSASGSAMTTTPAAPASKPASKGVKVSLRKVSFGKVLVGPNEHTVYLFLKDKGTTSKCYGKCAKVWTPLMSSGKPQAGPGLNASLLATTKRSDGGTQVTYGGHPVYYYDDDKKPGMTEGEGKKEFGAEWYAVGSDGKKVEKNGS